MEHVLHLKCFTYGQSSLNVVQFWGQKVNIWAVTISHGSIALLKVARDALHKLLTTSPCHASAGPRRMIWLMGAWCIPSS